jgi:hypothetical protein
MPNDSGTNHEAYGLVQAMHRRVAAQLFNATWDLMDRESRTPAEDDEMLRRAHASRLHWGVAGTPLQWARGEWLLSRAYSLVGDITQALRHADNCLALSGDHNLGPFDMGFALEAVARAHALAGDGPARDDALVAAMEAAAAVASDDDRRWLLENIDAVRRMRAQAE